MRSNKALEGAQRARSHLVEAVNIQPFEDDLKLTVLAAYKDHVRTEFYKAYPAEGDTQEQRQDARKKAFNWALAAAQKANVIGVRDMNQVQYVWFARNVEKD
jgi:hypothetical protein